MTTTQPRSILPAGMIPVEEARARILQHFAPLPAQAVPLLEAVGQVLAADVVATLSIPPLANTSMDGYAVRAADTQGATYDTPRTLQVVGWLPAGAVYDGSVGAGQAVRIMTGAPIPAGADAVVPFEETDEQDRYTAEAAQAQAPSDTAAQVQAPFDTAAQPARGSEAGGGTAPIRAQAPSNTVRVDVEAKPRANVREAGEDVRDGEVVLRAGTVIRPAHIGVIASLGLDRVTVHRRPRVAILSTGDELLRPGEPLAPGKIYDANAYSLAAAVADCGGVPRILDVARDTVEALTARIHEALTDADMLITSAGVSRGDFDVVKEVLAREGNVGFWTVNMRPGKPLAFGTFEVDGRVVPHLGLPGNPASALMTFELFGRAAIYAMIGNPEGWQRPVVRARAAQRIASGDGRRFYARATVSWEDGGYVARFAGSQSSGVLTTTASANALAVCPEHAVVEAGEECDVILLDETLAALSSAQRRVA